MNANTVNMKFHMASGFREQLATLQRIHVDKRGRRIKMVRSFVSVCQPGVASFDPDDPGASTFAAWQQMDKFVEDGMCGFFHTHPPGVLDFSDRDMGLQSGLAKTNGSKLLWHGVQACTGGGLGVAASVFVCCWMSEHRVFRYKYRVIRDDLSNPILVLPLPVSVQWNGHFYEVRD